MKIVSSSRLYTQRIGSVLAKFLDKKDIVALSGQLGAGKTILVKGIAKGLGFQPKKVLSSSFVIIRAYRTKKFPLYHFDLYRIKNTKQLLSLGYEEYLEGNGVCVIEWAERLKRVLNEDYLEIDISVVDENMRILHFIAHGGRYKNIINLLKHEHLGN